MTTVGFPAVLDGLARRGATAGFVCVRGCDCTGVFVVNSDGAGGAVGIFGANGPAGSASISTITILKQNNLKPKFENMPTLIGYGAFPA